MFLACTESNNPCLNFGTCSDADGDHTAECACVGGFSGDICVVPAGKTFNCQNNGNTCKGKL